MRNAKYQKLVLSRLRNVIVIVDVPPGDNVALV